VIRVLAGGCVLVALAGCGGDDKVSAPRSAPPVETVRAVTWADVSATLEPGLDLTSTNPCQRGDLRCLDLLIAEMQRRADLLAAACDHDVAFAVMYLRTTEASRRNVAAGRFEDPAAMAHFTAWFGRYYLDAYDRWHEGRTDKVPVAWQRAFEAADRRAVRSLGDLLLGMNAHITRDLAYAVSDLVREPTSEVDPDFLLFSTILQEISEQTMSELTARFDPELAGAAIPLVLGARPSFGALIAVWRTEAWQRGNALAAADETERAALEESIETDAAARADLMLPSVLYPPLVDGPERRDTYCAAHRGG
jgi:hypothetical protein